MFRIKKSGWKIFLGQLMLFSGLAAGDLPDFDNILPGLGLTNILQVDPSLRLDIKYATTDNFLKKNVYGSYTNCFLLTEVAFKLKKAQSVLKNREPSYSLKVYDGFRPRRVQRFMWALVEGTPKHIYVANPKTGSVHNFGAAVDLTIVNGQGAELDMGTEYDFFGPLAEPRFQEKYLKEGLLKSFQISNRELLKSVMVSAGFRPIMYEWWHFDGVPHEEVSKKYQMIE